MGHSDHPDARTAGAAAAAAALTHEDPRLLVVFCSANYDPEPVLAGIQTVAEGVPLIGCSSGHEIVAGLATRGQVVVTALGGPGFQVATAVGRQASEHPRSAGADAAACADAVVGAEHTALLLLTEGLAGDQEGVVAGVYSRVGASGARSASRCW
ncbi:MAG: hypothetical protein AUI14_01740 [Actinobacteria bacterium 13_2_20CM_2_71_6]|nr:MAG: hypothetical protein AUI14_01740 [Actinobacteria bacterium 13_2_20CM_2_71_6]